MKRWVHMLFPPPRRPVSPADAIPLAAFVILFVSMWFWLTASHRMVFTNPHALWLLVFTPWVWWLSAAGHHGMGRMRAAAALVVRLCIIGVFIMLIGEPRTVRSSDALSVVYVLDLSDSIGEGSSSKALQFILKSVEKRPEKDEAGLVVFGRNAAVELPPRQSFPLEAINSRIERDATNLEQALSLAAAMLPDENLGRIVLISDGTRTEGNLSRVLDDLKARGVSVDVLPIQYEYEHEVWLERLELPRFVKTGEAFETGIILSSLSEGSGKLVLRENGKVISEGEITYREGKNKFTVPMRERPPGYYEYAATIEPPDGRDGWEQNNTAMNFLFLQGEGRVMLVTDPVGTAEDWQRLQQALVESQRLVDVKVSHEFPRDSLSLLPYDCIIFANAPADAFDDVQFEALRSAVYELGIGFVMIGGDQSFGPGGYHRTPVEEALPVSMDVSQRKVMPKGALAIVLHTCEFAAGNTWAKRITKRAIEVLGAEDEVGVLLYSFGGDKWLFKLTPAGRYEELVPIINQAAPEDMPAFGPCMELGYQGLIASDAATRHMIIISDGDPAPPSPDLLKKFIDAKVSVSTVAINPHGGQNTQVMIEVAAQTGGKAYFAQSADELPAIFVKEAKTLKRSMIQNKTFTPTVEFPSTILKGIDALPQLKGYVLTSPKPRSSVILKGPEKEEVDPVLATWRYGLGKSAAWTSDLAPRWAAEWVQWEKYQAFVQQLITDVSRVDKQSTLRVQTFHSGGIGYITVEDYHPEESFLEIVANVAGPRDRNETVVLKQIAPRRYQGQIDLWGKGRYQIIVHGEGEGRSERTYGGFIVPYSAEYLRFSSNPLALREIADRTGGRELAGQPKDIEQIYNIDRHPKRSSRPVFDLFLIALACLIPLDVAVRRIQLDWYAVKGLFDVVLGRAEKPTATMSTLLERKKKVSESLVGGAAEAKAQRPKSAMPLPKRRAPSAEPAKRQPKPESQAAPTQPPTDEDSTTARLLKRKRELRQDDDSQDKT